VRGPSFCKWLKFARTGICGNVWHGDQIVVRQAVGLAQGGENSFVEETSALSGTASKSGATEIIYDLPGSVNG